MGDERTDSRSYAPGDVVETTSGVGVITQTPSDMDGNVARGQFSVLLGRTPGKSIGSASAAFLQPDAILRKLPVAPGMITTKKDSNSSQRYMVHDYNASTQMFRIAPLSDPVDVEVSTTPKIQKDADKDTEEKEAEEVAASTKKLSRLSLTGQLFSVEGDGFASTQADGELVPPGMLQPAASAKFYPLLIGLIRRGDETAAVTNDFLKKKEVSNVIGKATEFTQKQSTHAMDQANEAMEQAQGLNPDDAVDDLVSKVKEVVKEEEVQQLMTMIKDEELTVLLERGKERLEKLLQQEIPKATEQALQSTGIRVLDDRSNADSPYMKAIVQSRKMALRSMQKLLDQAQVNPNDLEAIRESLGENFNTMFDSMTEAAKSDRRLASILETMNEQTAEWQEATGRLMATRSASLFMEGASRIQARAANLFSKDQLQWAGEVGSKFTKAFTEGDAAVARLKSIELGESVRDRLVEAIEVRSESLGGLDGIIAGALTTMKGSESGDQMKGMLITLQSRASSATKDANETLISVLACQSEYRDIALLKLEQVLCDLESQFGDDFSPEDIAALAQGEGGTSKLFEPIAKRAAKEIEKQLDAAEESVSDPTMIDVLKHVRKIVSGELTVHAVMDEVVNILNDDNVVAAGENLVMHSEQVLDAIEGVSGNKVVDDVMQIAEKAGFTKDSVMEGIEKLDVNELLDNAGNALSDEKARAKLLSDATDTALDFILRILPSMPIPPFDGVKDGLVYHIANLSMQGFKVRKENILVQIAGMRATKREQPIKIEELSEATGPSVDLDSDAKSALRSESSLSEESFMDLDTDVADNVVVKATELLIIDVKGISALFDDAVWGFEQTYLPYLKGNGQFDVEMSDGSIRLVFELRRRLKNGAEKKYGKFDPEDWVPVLALHDRTCSIGSVDFTMQGNSRLTWVINKAASMFKGLLRDYVVRTILRILADKSGWILSKLNEGLTPFWDVLLRTAKLKMEDLEEAGLEDIVAAKPVEKSNLIELVWREHLPLGMNLLLNDESGHLKVVDFPRGSQARTVCEGRNLDPAGFKGAAIMAVNGIRYQNDDDLFEALRDPGRPKTIQFELPDTEDAERIRKFVEESQDDKSNKSTRVAAQRTFCTRTATFVDAIDLGIEFANAADTYGLVVRKFLEGEGGIVLAAERKDEINVGDLLTHINGKLVLGSDGAGRIKALKLLEAEGNTRPLTLAFSSPYLHRAVFEKSPGLPTSIGGPEEFEMEVKKFEGSDTKRVVVTGFKEVDSVSEKSGVLLGDYLVFLNGVAVGAGCRWMGEKSGRSLEEVFQMIQSKSNYPIGLTFARPWKQSGDESRGWFGSNSANKEHEISMDSSETTCVSAESPDQLGLVLDMKGYWDIIVKDLEAVKGPFQQLTRTFADDKAGTKENDNDNDGVDVDVDIDDFTHLSIESVNGEFVPSFASTKMVKSAMDRSWKSEDRVEVMFCDDERKTWVQQQLQTLQDDAHADADADADAL